MSGEQQYIVEKILSKGKVDGEIKYLIKWLDWPVSDATWEPINNLKGVLYMLEEFDKKIADEIKNNRNMVNKMFFETQQGTREINKSHKHKKVYTDYDKSINSS